jgi:hypothetical protein
MSVEIDTAHHLAKVTLKGEISVGVILVAFQEMLKHPDFGHDMNSLWDMSEASLKQVSGADMGRLEARMRQFRDIRRGVKSACVCPEDLDYRLARMYQMMSEWSSSARFRVFQDMEEAQAWLLEDGEKRP